jgi:TPR repeat protein
MNSGAAAGSDLVEQIKWWDALDVFGGRNGIKRNLAKGLQMARQCLHPDAQWLVSLVPAGVEVTRESMKEALLAQGEDPCALFLAEKWGWTDGYATARAAEMGYAPAQAGFAHRLDGSHLSFKWAQLSAAQNDRHGIYQLGLCTRYGWRCAKNKEAAKQLFLRAAELGDPSAMHGYGDTFGLVQWESFYWWSMAASKGYRKFAERTLCYAVEQLLPWLEVRHYGRVLHWLAKLLGIGLDLDRKQLYDEEVSDTKLVRLQRVIELHADMMDRARDAIGCWSMAARRCGVVKDIRVKIAKTAWEEPWQWGEAKAEEELESE